MKGYPPVVPAVPDSRPLDPSDAGVGGRDFGRVLLVEDDPDDQRFLRRALEKSGREVVLDVVQDGQSAMEYLSAALRSSDPAQKRSVLVVLCDVHLPVRSGWDVLEWIRLRPEFSGLPVLVWTSLPTPEGADRAAGLGALRYLSKPRDLAGYGSVAGLILSVLGD